MKAMVPANGLTVLRDEMDRLFDRMWDRDLPGRGIGEWTPVLDFSENKDLFLVTMEVPGLDPKDIKISLQDQTLTISGERKKEDEEKEKDERFYRIERSYGAFTRAIRLPMPVEEHRVNAVFKNGVLTISIPKAEASKGIFIPIKTA